MLKYTLIQTMHNLISKYTQSIDKLPHNLKVQ